MKSKCVVILLICCISLTDKLYGDDLTVNAAIVQNANGLLSVDSVKRTQSLNELMATSRDIHKILLQILIDAKKQHREDARFNSPLHVAILAVSSWKVIDAEPYLLSWVDYELDPCSFPVGMDVPGSHLFPAAQALVDLNVNSKKIAQAIAVAKNARTIHLLTWVLHEQIKNIEHAKWLLRQMERKAFGTTEKQNLSLSLTLLEKLSVSLPSSSWILTD